MSQYFTFQVSTSCFRPQKRMTNMGSLAYKTFRNRKKPPLQLVEFCLILNYFFKMVKVESYLTPQKRCEKIYFQNGRGPMVIN
jgi:hypothetical protein